MDKKRILWQNEASFLATGFSVLSNEILSRLYQTNKYEIAEMGRYSASDDPRSSNVPWKFYGAIPDERDTFATQRYNSSPAGQFGEAVFEQVCLDFKPDIVIGFTDNWMDAYVLNSPFRNNFKFIWCPTVDGSPQRSIWLDDYAQADMILTYSQYGKNVLEKEAPNRIKVFDIVRPGVNPEIYKPLDKKKLRHQFSINPDINIILTVMRNQRRKLFPDLIEMFRDFIQHCVKQGNEKLAKNTYLYLHTSYPDVGFDISRHIMQNGVGHKVLVTYTCANCGFYWPDYFQTERTFCRKCSQLMGHMPNTQYGIPSDALCKIYNLADCYIQYSISEGWAIPVTEAKACELPAFAMDHTAMSEQVNIEGCFPLKVGKFFHEPVIETEQVRALPDDKDTIEKLYKFFTTPKETREKWGKLARKNAVENCSFNRAASIFEKAIDNIEIYDTKITWYNTKENLINSNIENIPKFSSNSEFIDWCLDNIVHKSHLKNTQWRNELIKGLNIGYIVNRHANQGREPFDHNIAINKFLNIAKNHNMWEKARITAITPYDSNNIDWKIL